LQVHPVVARLCTPIEGTDAARLADCLGLDPSRFAGTAAGAGGDDAREDALVSGAAFFDDPARFKVCRERQSCCPLTGQ
jgi:DNA polymerase alpha subunit A